MRLAKPQFPLPMNAPPLPPHQTLGALGEPWIEEAHAHVQAINLEAFPDDLPIEEGVARQAWHELARKCCVEVRVRVEVTVLKYVVL